VNGDLMTAGQTVTVESAIDGDLATAGSQDTVAAPVSGYVLAAGRNAVIGDDARLAGSTVQFEGRVERDLSIGAATAVIDGHVGGNVEARADRVSVMPGAVIDGDLVVHAMRPPDISPDAQVRGQVRYEEIEQSRFGGWFAMWLVGFLALLILGLPIVAFAPVWATRIADVMSARFGVSLLTGLVLLVLVPLVVALLAVTVVGIPLAVVLAALYFSVLLASGVFVSCEIGAWLLGRMGRPAAPWQRLTLGAIIVSFVISLPMVGWVFAILIVMLGFGALFLERRSARVATA
jgi:hypothetical protein